MSIIESIRGGLIVSCQAIRDTPLSRPDVLGLIATSVVHAGAVGIRAEGLENLAAIREAVSVPLIGLWKVGTEGPYITPTLEHALAVAKVGSDIVAIDGTRRPRPDGRALQEVVLRIHTDIGCLVLADISTLEEGIAAERAGADLLATTLSGYTPYSRRAAGPDLDLVQDLSAGVGIPVLAEGRIGTPAEARQAMEAGAYAVVVGAAITDPAAITRAFLQEFVFARSHPEDDAASAVVGTQGAGEP
jgi:N-acylglucosamine-6-phosphate 2-epimerase